ncbi:hypothetical protein FRB95_006579 [Tulasnella sp. JGI-2019a]|nr:hypothetical protein FRB95_006579 [Tulasnella sp. JGI-2019a]
MVRTTSFGYQFETWLENKCEPATMCKVGPITPETINAFVNLVVGASPYVVRWSDSPLGHGVHATTFPSVTPKRQGGWKTLFGALKSQVQRVKRALRFLFPYFTQVYI